MSLLPAPCRAATANSQGLGFIIRESAEEYQAKAKEHLTSHQLGDFRRCPLLYQRKKLGLIEDEDRPAYLIGRALHTLVLEGRARFEQEYAVGGPINPKTGEMFGPTTKAYAEWAAAQGKAVLTLSQFDLVESMAEGVRANGMAIDLLSEGIPEGVVRADYRDSPPTRLPRLMEKMTALSMPHNPVMGARTLIEIFDADYLRALVKEITSHLKELES